MAEKSRWDHLLKQIDTASGSDPDLDSAVQDVLGDLPPDQMEHPRYTSSVDACIVLIEKHMPGGHWHVGFGPRGIEPYASLTVGTERWESHAPTVPLALLSALLKALKANT